MHLNQIHSFLAVSKTLNFTGAARQLGVPQSTISRQINDLESQLGVRLFYRTKRDVQLTDEGRIFLPYANEIAEAARKGSFAVRQLHEGAAGRLSIAAADACRTFLADALSAFHQRYPEIAVDITPMPAGQSLMEDMKAPYDFWFLYRDMLLDTDNFEYAFTHREPLCIARRRDHAATDHSTANPGIPAGSFAESDAASVSPTDPGAASESPATVDIVNESSIGSGSTFSPDPAKENPAGSLPDLRNMKDLSSERFILISEETDPILYMQTMNYCRTHRFTPKAANTFPEVSSVLLSVSAGLGISILPQSLLAGSASQLEILPMDDESYAIDCIAAWKPSLLNPAASLFLQILREMLPES